jgi:hypothetical protein
MIKGLIIGLVISFGFLIFLDYALSIPSVHESYSTRECVKVENYPGVLFGKTEYSCENKPSKYNHVWVQ